MMKMRDFYMVFLLCNGFILAANGQDTVNIQLSFHKEDFKLLVGADGLLTIGANDNLFFYSEKPGHPVIPYRNIDVLVPSGAELVDYSFSIQLEDYPQRYMLRRNVQPAPIIQGINGNFEDSVIEFTGVFPEQVVSYNAYQIMQGYTWFNFSTAPFLYNGHTGVLSLITHLDLQFTYKLKQGIQEFSEKEGPALQAVRGRVENPEDMTRYYPDRGESIKKSAQDKLDYLIITTSELKEGFQPLIDWKIRKGLKAEIICLDEIYDRYDEHSPQLKIKRCLEEYYKERSLTWVLLGGDFEIVPVQSCFGLVAVEHVDYNIPADLFYACFDKSFDWNATIDEKIGEPYFDFVDIYPEVYISRAPVKDLEHVEVFVRKSIEYEISTPLENFAERILMSGVKSWNAWDGKSDNHHWNEKMFNSYVRPGWKGKRYGLYDTGTDFPGGPDYQVTASTLSDQLNRGYNVFHFAGHGNSTSLIMEQGAGFDVEDAFSLNNQNAGIILSSTCDINAFDSIDPCLSEALLRNPDGGCVAFWGSSREAWGIPDVSNILGPSYVFNAKFLENLYRKSKTNKGYSFASLTSLSKASFGGDGTVAGANWFLQYSLNAMGDPEMPVYSKDPSDFDNVRIYTWNNKLIVNTGGVEKCRICVTSLDLKDGFQEVIEGVSFYTFDDLPEFYQITITKPNYRPFEFISDHTSDIHSSLLKGIRIYPNPTKDFVTIDYLLPTGTICIYDLNGKIQMQEEISFGLNRLSLSALSRGTYVLRVITNKGLKHLKLVKL